jgi:prepilin-type N-terminal cleavage/methylation domain-containing protein
MTDARRRSQAGYTLIELMVATSIGVFVMGALTSVILTTVLSTNVATSRVDAANQVRNLQLTAYDDMALSLVPTPAGCGTPASPCTTQPIVLQGSRMSNQSAGTATPYTVSYTWSAAVHTIVRQVSGGASRTIATDVTSFSWYLDTSQAHHAVVIRLTVTIDTYNSQYAQSQSMRFYPRVTGP